MVSFTSLLTFTHLVGLALGVGAATLKLTLIFKCKADPAFVPTYLKVLKPMTRQIVLGITLLTLSGVGWLLLGYGFTTVLIVKIVLVAAIWILGPIIDNVIEPKFRKLAPGAGEPATPEFLRVQKNYAAVELLATALFYVIIILWVLV